MRLVFVVFFRGAGGWGDILILVIFLISEKAESNCIPLVIQLRKYLAVIQRKHLIICSMFKIYDSTLWRVKIQLEVN